MIIKSSWSASLFALFASLIFAHSSAGESLQNVFAQRAKSEAETLNQAMQHENAGEWGEALACWTKWSPLEDCTGEESATKNYHIAVCLLGLGNTQAAVSNCLQTVFGPEQRGSSSAATPMLLLKLYQATDQTRDLVRMVDRFERKTMSEYRQKGYFQKQPETNWFRTLPTRPIREALHIKALQSQGNIAELIAIAQDSSWATTDITNPSFVRPDWRCQMAANALAELGEPAVNAIEPISSEVVRRKGNTSWLIYALGKSNATNALQALVNGAEKEHSWNCVNFVCAISMHGSDGHQLLEQIASQWGDGMQAQAKGFLLNPKKCIALLGEIELPKMQRGSLPVSCYEYGK